MKDKWANYSTAQQLGFDDPDTQKSSYEIEQEIKGRAGEVGAWEEVIEPISSVSSWQNEDRESKRNLGEYVLGEQDDGDNWKFQHRDKKPVYDIYDDEDWDPSGLRVRIKEERLRDQTSQHRNGESSSSAQVMREDVKGGLKREEWDGRLDLHPVGHRDGKANIKREEGMVYIPNGGGWIKAEPDSDVPPVEPQETVTREDGEHGKPTGDTLDSASGPGNGQSAVDDQASTKTTMIEHASSAVVNPTAISPSVDIKPELDESPSSVSNSLFKKRRPPPAARKK